MHVNFGVINDRISNVLAMDVSKYAIALSYAKCDSDYYKSETKEVIERKISLNNSYDENKDHEMRTIAIRVKNLNFSYSKHLTQNSIKILQNCSLM